MKIKRLILGAVFTLILTPVANTFAINTQDFYFEDFMGDYYLSKDEDSISHLKVVESVTAVFPNYKQNKGICRQIPFANQGGANITLPNLTESNTKVTRNGIVEPIYSIDIGDGYYDVCTGTDEYVLGEQTYTFEYEFIKVVTEFNENGKEWQELYWDTNGNGAMQKFNKVTARVHLANAEWWTGDSWCYVGRYGENGQDRCAMTEIEDGMEFTAVGLAAHENLTFDMELKPGTFVVPAPEKNYAYVWTLVGLVLLCAISIIIVVAKLARSHDKVKYYKELFVKPEYQPNVKYSLPEMAEIYIGKKKDEKVAMLLELVVKRKIEFKKTDKRNWSIIIKNTDGVSEGYMNLIAILNGGSRPVNGDEIELKKRTATRSMAKLKKSIEDTVLESLKRDKLVENNYKISDSTQMGPVSIAVATLIIVPIVVIIGLIIMRLLDGVMGYSGIYGGEMVIEEYFFPISLVVITVTVATCITLANSAQKCETHTELGLKMSRYMDGLKLYISMAEAERIKILQSVRGADVSAEGIVRLYEKLLPYAAVFGLEESWMNEMEKYCEAEKIEEPDYLMAGITAAGIVYIIRTASNIVNTSTTMSSSGGGLSSGLSGGGGGGFSGGGGGGGGFGGR